MMAGIDNLQGGLHMTLGMRKETDRSHMAHIKHDTVHLSQHGQMQMQA